MQRPWYFSIISCCIWLIMLIHWYDKGICAKACFSCGRKKTRQGIDSLLIWKTLRYGFKLIKQPSYQSSIQLLNQASNHLMPWRHRIIIYHNITFKPSSVWLQTIRHPADQRQQDFIYMHLVWMVIWRLVKFRLNYFKGGLKLSTSSAFTSNLNCGLKLGLKVGLISWNESFVMSWYFSKRLRCGNGDSRFLRCYFR